MHHHQSLLLDGRNGFSEIISLKIMAISAPYQFNSCPASHRSAPQTRYAAVRAVLRQQANGMTSWLLPGDSPR
jgi:hypothetical protein